MSHLLFLPWWPWWASKIFFLIWSCSSSMLHLQFSPTSLQHILLSTLHPPCFYNLLYLLSDVLMWRAKIIHGNMGKPPPIITLSKGNASPCSSSSQLLIAPKESMRPPELSPAILEFWLPWCFTTLTQTITGAAEVIRSRRQNFKVDWSFGPTATLT